MSIDALISILVRLLLWSIKFVIKLLIRVKCLVSFGLPKKQPPIKKLILLDSASTLASKIRNRQVTSEEVVKSFIARIEEIQPVLNCVTEKRYESALEEARKCDKLLESCDAPTVNILAEEKPFFGVPFSVKECIAVEKMKQTGGLISRSNTSANEDAECVRLMRQAGGIPIVTTNIPQLAMWMESYNCVYGVTRNPYNTWRTPGGSSGGEGCILASAGSPCGLGTDIAGSIRLPSHFNGIFGHKPTSGVVDRRGQYPKVLTDEQDQMNVIGPMSRYAEDLAPMLRVISGDNADKLDLQSKVDTSKLKIYYIEEEENCPVLSLVDPEIKDSLRRAVEHLEKTYNVEATKVSTTLFEQAPWIWFANMSTKPEEDMTHDLTDRKGNLNLGLEFFKWLTRTSEHTLALLSLCLLGKITSVIISKKGNKKLKEKGKKLREEFQEMLGDDGIFICPTFPTAAPLHYEPILKPFDFAYTCIISVLGLPSTACPLGLNSNGLPIGVQVISGLYNDRLSLAVAEELQKAFKGWVPPPVET